MAKEFSDWFYHTQAWQKTRAAFIKYCGGYCQRCVAEYKAGLRDLKDVQPIQIVHHRIYLMPENINDPKVSLSFDNLEGLCAEHHNREHKSAPRRYTFAADGSLVSSERGDKDG